ncbi:hypothetical protein [Embleya sp. NPDC001921]
MSEIWGLAGIIGSAAITAAGGWFTLRATHRATQAGIEAQRAVAEVAAEPEQRRQDLEAFRAIRAEQSAEIDEMRAETRSLRSLVRAFALYVGQLTAQMRQQGIEPPAPPDRVDEYNRTGV